METIKAYLNTLFSHLPYTKEVKKLKEDMLLHMEDKYSNLVLEGKSENEAIGIVISEFGSIEEIAEEMGVDLTQHSKTIDSQQKTMDESEVKSFMLVTKRASLLTAIGVFLILLGSAVLIGISLVSESTIGLIILMLLITVAVALFIFGCGLTKPYEFLEKNEGGVALTPNAFAYVERKKAGANTSETIGTIAGVSFILLGVIVLLISTMTRVDVPSFVYMPILLLLIGVGVAVVIYTTSESTGIDKLLGERVCTTSSKKSGKVIGAVAAVW